MTQHEAKKKLSAKDLLLPLLIGTLGVVGAVVAYLAVPGFLEVEVVLLLVMAVGAAIGYNRRIVRGLVTVPFLYAATGVAAILYQGDLVFCVDVGCMDRAGGHLSRSFQGHEFAQARCA